LTSLLKLEMMTGLVSELSRSHMMSESLVQLSPRAPSLPRNSTELILSVWPTLLPARPGEEVRAREDGRHTSFAVEGLDGAEGSGHGGGAQALGGGAEHAVRAAERRGLALGEHDLLQVPQPDLVGSEGNGALGPDGDHACVH
jgi:hypothetical protein